MEKLRWLKPPEVTLIGLVTCAYIVAAATDNFLSIRDYGTRVFRDAGVVWMEEINGAYVMQHMFMNTVTTGVTKTEPRAIAMAPPGEHNFTHIDMDHEGRLFVMADPLSKKIMALSFDEYFTFIFYDLYQGTSNQVNGITIDWKSNVVYWTDALYDVILAVSLTYPNAAVIIVNEGLEEPGDIAVHPIKEYLFWAEGSPYRPRLMRSGLAGEQVQDLLVLRDRRPSTLYMDFNDDRLYWLYKMDDSAVTDGIGSCDVNGHDVKFHITRDLNFFGINVFYERVLLAVKDDRRDVTEILMLDRNDRGDTVARIPVEGRLLVLHVLDSTRQLDTRNPCDTSMCPGVCISSNMTERCFCSPLVSTDPEAEFECEPSPPFHGLLFAKGDGIYTVNTNFAEYKGSSYSSDHGRTNLSLVVDSRHAIKAITSDVRNNKIYFYESKTKIIKSVSTKNGLSPEVVSLAVDDVGGMSFDWLRNNLYWTDKTYGHVIVAKANGDFPFVLVRNVDKPTAIAVHPSQRMVFWSCSCVGLLERAYLDGTSRRTLAPAWNRTVTAIALDFDSDRVFLTTSFEVLVMDLSGTDVRFVYKEPRRQFSGITIFHDYVLVTDTDWMKSGLLVFNRKNGKYRKMKEVKFPFFDYGNWYGVAFHHISNQPEVRPSNSRWLSRLEADPCVQRDDYCDQVCVTAAQPECLCTLGYIRNRTRCEIGEPYRQFLILVDQRQRRLLQLEANRYYSIPVQVLHQPHRVEFDPVAELVYWTDLDAGTISRAHLNGDNQEIIVMDRSKYFLNLAIFPEYRLLYYLERPRHRVKDRSSIYWDQDTNWFSQLMVYQLDTGRVYTLNRVLEEPRGLAINKEHGYIFLTDVGSIWRSRVNESQFTDLVQDLGTTSLLATSGDYLFFATVLPSRVSYRPPRTKIVRCLLDGTNITVLHDFVGDHVTSLAVSGDVIYWGNSSSRAIHSAPASNLMSVETLGPSQMLFQPTGIYIHPPGTTTVSQCDDCDDYVCLPSLDETCVKKPAHRQDPVSDESHAAPCRVPDIQYGDIRGNQPGRLVPHGYVAHVQCYPAHQSSHPYPLTCVNSVWKPNPPHCVLEYDICGTPSRGYKLYTWSGKYFVYPGNTHVQVIAIGGGGGGYDVTNPNITKNRKAGDGGTSSFGKYLSAYGGFGGRAHRAGAGGRGLRNGETGQLRDDCSTGGTAGFVASSPTGPGSTLSLFAGTGGYSFNCTKNQIEADVRVLLGEVSTGSTAGRFGGGAGSKGGSPGGGGGWSYLPISLSAREVVYVTVGAAGYPSYGAPSFGAVIVRWGDLDFEKFPDHDFLNDGCLPGM